MKVYHDVKTNFFVEIVYILGNETLIRINIEVKEKFIKWIALIICFEYWPNFNFLLPQKEKIESLTGIKTSDLMSTLSDQK